MKRASFTFIICSLLGNLLWGNETSVPYNQASDLSRLVDELRNQEGISPYSTPFNYREILGSDLGAQRPVKTKSIGFGYYLGFETSINYSNNPNGIEDDKPNRYAAGIWENSLRNNFRLGAFDLGSVSFSPILSIHLSTNSYFGHELYEDGSHDNELLNLSFAGIFQLANNFSIRPSLALSSQFNNWALTYREFRPSIAVGKIISLSPIILTLDFSASYSISHSEVSTGLESRSDQNNRFECSFISGLNLPIGNFEINPIVGLTLSRYTKQSNRTDFSTILGMDIRYNFADWVSLSFASNYSLRNSNVSSDYSRFDSSLGASLNAKF